MVPGRRSLVVSLHDVSPHTWEQSRTIIDRLERQGVHRVSLLVIPNHHRRGHFLESPEFCAWLRQLVDAGHEAVIHGYFHERAARTGESLRDRWITRSYTAGEGEFYDINYREAKERVTKAQAEFQRAELNPVGFIAPAWLLSEDGEEALRDLGFTYTTRLRSVSDLQGGSVEQSQSLCWSVRAAWRRVVSLGWNTFLYHRLRDSALMRLAIHPVDLAHERIWNQITRLTAAAQLQRQVITYADWASI